MRNEDDYDQESDGSEEDVRELNFDDNDEWSDGDVYDTDSLSDITREINFNLEH